MLLNITWLHSSDHYYLVYLIWCQEEVDYVVAFFFHSRLQIVVKEKLYLPKDSLLKTSNVWNIKNIIVLCNSSQFILEENIGREKRKRGGGRERKKKRQMINIETGQHTEQKIIHVQYMYMYMCM